jgi:hypothetical protein
MNTIPPAGRPNPLRRWFLSLLTTRPAHRLLYITFLATLTLNPIPLSGVGGDFQVNTYTPNPQSFPAVALDTDADFVIVWQSIGSNGGDTSNSSVQGRRYSPAGIPQEDQFQVNTYTTGFQSYPTVTVDDDGDFVVVWESTGSAGSDSDSLSIQGQRYNTAGLPQGNQFQVNTDTTGHQRLPAVSMDSDGDFVVVWQSYGSGSDGDGYSIQGQRYNSHGLPQGSEFQVNTYTTNNQRYPAISLDDDGDFVAVWQSDGSSGSDTSFHSIQGQRYNSTGAPQGNQFQVNTYTTLGQHRPAVALDSDGDFVVVWDSNGSPGSAGADTSAYSIQGQRYNAAAAPQGSQFQVNTYTTSFQWFPAVTLDSDGDFVIVWTSHGSTGTDNDYGSIQGQLYNSDGDPQGSHFQVNTYITSYQEHPTVSLDDDGNFVATWVSDGQATDSNQSIAARLFNLQPTGVSLNPLQPAATLPPPRSSLFVLLALLTALATLLTALYRRRRHPSHPQF